MKRDPIDTWLERLTYGVALVRVLRGDNPEQVQADVARINEKAVQLREQLRDAFEGHERKPGATPNGASERRGSGDA